MALEEITRKVVSYCDIPQDLTEDSWLSEYRCDSYVSHSLPSEEEKEKFDIEPLDEWLAKTYPELIGTKFLIEMDY